MDTLVVVLLFAIAITAFVLQGLKRIPAEPPHVAATTWFGRRTGGVVDEGWRFFPFYPWMRGAILVEVTKTNLDIETTTRTPLDKARVTFPTSITFTPDRKNILPYLNAGGRAGVEGILRDIVQEAIRERTNDPDEGMGTLEEAQHAKRKYVAGIVGVIAGLDPGNPVNREQINELAAKLRHGNGAVQIRTLGIVLNRFNIGSIEPGLGVASAAEQFAIEKRERMAEREELEGVREQINKLVADGHTLEEATMIVQVERKKATRAIDEHRLSISRETSRALAELGSVFMDRLPSGKKPKE